jgi:hypothetical protein
MLRNDTTASKHIIGINIISSLVPSPSKLQLCAHRINGMNYIYIVLPVLVFSFPTRKGDGNCYTFNGYIACHRNGDFSFEVFHCMSRHLVRRYGRAPQLLNHLHWATNRFAVLSVLKSNDLAAVAASIFHLASVTSR